MDGPFGGEGGRCGSGFPVGQLPVEEVVGGVNLSLLFNERPKNLVNACWNSKNGPKFAITFCNIHLGVL